MKCILQVSFLLVKVRVKLPMNDCPELRAKAVLDSRGQKMKDHTHLVHAKMAENTNEKAHTG